MAYTVTLDGLQPPPDELQKGVVIEWLQISPMHDMLLASIETGGRWQSAYIMVKLMAGPPISTESDSEFDKVGWYCSNINNKKLIIMPLIL